MATARLLIGDVHDRLDDIDTGSVQSAIYSPPYWRKRRYVDDDSPVAHLEMGQEPSPGEYLAGQLRVTDALWRVVADDGTIWINVGDTASGSGGWGGDVDQSNRGGGRRWSGSGKATGYKETAGDLHRVRTSHGARGAEGMPRAKSVCWIPELLGASLAYGRNVLTGEPCRQWITRPSITWCKPSVTPGAIHDKFREATELFILAAKQPQYYFDLDAVRVPPKSEPHPRTNPQAYTPIPGQPNRKNDRSLLNPKGVPPFNYWIVNTSDYSEAHYATFPPELIERPVLASCPVGGTILDPFAGSGTTLAVATGHGRNAIGIDFDVNNVELIRGRVGFLLELVDTGAAA